MARVLARPLMIHFAIGTKAQFIKMAPIMHLLQRNQVDYHLLDLSQHGDLTGRILLDFELNPRVTRLGNPGESVTTYMEAARWLTRGVWQIVAHRRTLRERWFLGRGGIALLHGDTLSTLLGLYLARAARIKSALVEAGLTSGHLLDPFPEEWIRRHASVRVDFLFPPDSTAEAWLRARRFKGRIVNTGYNTGRDALQIALGAGTVEAGGYSVVTLHRLETLMSARRLKATLDHILKLADVLGPLRFYMHPPTEKALRRLGLLSRLVACERIEVRPLSPYPEFVRSVAGARFVLTDGGSIQEEAFYLAKPCLVLRDRTERSEGIGFNSMLSSWDVAEDVAHLRGFAEHAHVPSRGPLLSASQTIVDAVDEFRAG